MVDPLAAPALAAVGPPEAAAPEAVLPADPELPVPPEPAVPVASDPAGTSCRVARFAGTRPGRLAPPRGSARYDLLPGKAMAPWDSLVPHPLPIKARQIPAIATAFGRTPANRVVDRLQEKIQPPLPPDSSSVTKLADRQVCSKNPKGSGFRPFSPPPPPPPPFFFKKTGDGSPHVVAGRASSTWPSPSSVTGGELVNVFPRLASTGFPSMSIRGSGFTLAVVPTSFLPHPRLR